MLRSLSSLVLVVPLAVAVGCPGGELSEGEGEAGEGEGEEGEGDAGEGEGEEGEGEEGEGEPPPPPPPENDTCATAEDIGTGGTVEGTTIGATNDTPCPDFSDPDFPAGEDVAYTFTVAEPSGVRISALSLDDFGFGEITVSLFSDDSCGGGGVTVDDRTCVDQGSQSVIEIGEIPAGTYFIVVETPFFASDFELTTEITAPFCIGDIADTFERGFDPVVTGNETAEDAVALNGDGTFGSISRNSDTSTDEQYDVHLCDGDVDYFLVGHLGGLMTLGVTGAGAEAELREAVIDVEASKAASNVIYSEGDVVVGVPGEDVEVAAGLYLLKVTENQTLEGAANIAYDVAITHQCEADDFDVPNAALDEFFELQQEPVALPLEAPVERTICGADADIALFDVLFDGEFALTFGGDTGRDLSVGLFSVDDAGVETPIEANSFDDADNNVQVVSADVVAGRVIARISGPATPATGAYNWTVALPGLTGTPDNDLCGDAVVVVANAGAVGGRTVGATDDYLEGTCNFQFDDEEVADVFFRFTLDTAIDTQIALEGIADYSGTLGVFKLPDGACPDDLATLEPVTITGVDFFGDPTEDPACGRSGEILQLPALPAGDYLGIVDDSTFGGPGVFKVKLETFADGFPSACDEELVRAVDVSDAVTTVDLTGADFSVDSLAPGPACALRGDGNDLVLSFTAGLTGTLRVETTGDVDMILSLRTAACDDVTDEICDDDGAGVGLNSLIEAPVVQGQTYFVVAGGLNSGDPAATDEVGVSFVITP